MTEKEIAALRLRTTTDETVAQLIDSQRGGWLEVGHDLCAECKRPLVGKLEPIFGRKIGTATEHVVLLRCEACGVVYSTLVRVCSDLFSSGAP